MAPVRTLVFAKAPRAGLAKTRLIPALGAEGAAALARRMFDHMLASACAAGIGPVELCATPALDDPAWDGVVIPAGIARSAQGEGNLGERLARHAQRVLGGGEALLLVGTDCIELDEARLRAAAQALERHDCVLHPTLDGGYALLGLTRYHDSLFTDIAWSTASVASTTMERIERLGWSLHRAALLHDIDEPADLHHLPSHWRPAAPGEPA
jgi:rSAM/selenodomain-associated transferase 1